MKLKASQMVMVIVTYPDIAPSIYLHRTWKGGMQHAAAMASSFAGTIYASGAEELKRLEELRAKGDYNGALIYWEELSEQENGERIDVDIVQVEE